MVDWALRWLARMYHVFQKYKGIVKSNHEVNHYNLTPVPGSNGRLFFSKFADQDVIVMVGLTFDESEIPFGGLSHEPCFWTRL